MMIRVARLVRAELLKLFSHPFSYGAVVVLAVTVLVAVESGMRKGEASNSVTLFSHGFRTGLVVAGYVLLVLSSMMFAGEFDRGTIKILLTRPITRTDLFAAKALTVLLLGAGLYAFTVWLGMAASLARGELGPIWDRELYVIVQDYDKAAAAARQAVGLCLAPFLVAGFLGILVSTLTESSGYAVAIAMVAFLVGDLATGLIRDRDLQEWIFFHYVPYVTGKFMGVAEGGNEAWSPTIGERALWLPLATMAALGAAAYGLFRSRNVHA